MRQILHPQLSLVESALDHPHAHELQKIHTILESCPEIAERVHADLIRGLKNSDTGRAGMMSAHQVFRALLIKQMNAFSYEELAFHLADSRTYRAFCDFGIGDDIPSASTLQRDIKKIPPESLEAINRVLLQIAREDGLEKGRKVRVDCTVVESNIHHPTDSSLLRDSVHVLTRLMKQSMEAFELDLSWVDHRRRAKKRALGILTAKRKNERRKRYQDLLFVTRQTVESAECFVQALDVLAMQSIQGAEESAFELRHVIHLARQILWQTTQRVMDGVSVPAQEKIVSIFESHTDIIVKDRRETYYGHKIVLTGGSSGLLTDLMILKGNPADSTLAVHMISRQEEIYGRVPRQAAYDGGFASKDNLRTIKAMGVQDVCFAKRCGLQIADMAKSTWVYKRLRDFRAGIEGMISFLKRCFGLGRCNWRGFASFKAYAWSSVVTANLLLMARHALA